MEILCPGDLQNDLQVMYLSNLMKFMYLSSSVENRTHLSP